MHHLQFIYRRANDWLLSCFTYQSAHHLRFFRKTNKIKSQWVNSIKLFTNLKKSYFARNTCCIDFSCQNGHFLRAEEWDAMWKKPWTVCKISYLTISVHFVNLSDISKCNFLFFYACILNIKRKVVCFFFNIYTYRSVILMICVYKISPMYIHTVLPGYEKVIDWYKKLYVP